MLAIDRPHRHLRRLHRGRRASTSRWPTARSCASSGRAGAARARCSAPSPASSPTPAAGSAWDGDDLARVPPHRRGFGLMFQDHALFPHRDVHGNVRVRAAHAATPARRDRRRARLPRSRWSGSPGFERPADPRALGRRAAARRARPRRSRPSRGCSCSTSRSARSTARCASGSSPSCARCSCGSGSPPSSSPTTTTRRSRSPTASS